MDEADSGDAVDRATDGATGPIDPSEGGDTGGAPSTSELESLRSRVDALAERLDEDVEDLRGRLVRTYREVEKRAAADHTHPETADRIDGMSADIDTLATRIDAIESELEAIEDDVGGIESELGAVGSDLDAVETDLDGLGDEVDRLDGAVASATADLDELDARVETLADANDDAMEKLSKVANAVVRTQRQLRAMRQERAERERIDAILAEANRHGVRTADCAGCSNSVRLSLLSKPECPYCGSRFGGVEPGRRFIGTSTLTVDDRPALEGEVGSAGDGETGASGTDNDRTDADSATDDISARGGGRGPNAEPERGEGGRSR